MNAAWSPNIPTAALLELAAYLRDTASPLATTEVATLAIREWIASAKAPGQPTARQSGRGYQWKCLFLPDSTQLRMSYGSEFFYARVVDDAIVYRGARVSPRQFTLAVAGDGHNAWRELWIRFPGESSWKLAALRRSEMQRQVAPKTESPAEAMAAAAAAMSDALKTALKLVDHANAQSIPKYERRLERHRRAEDLMIEDCRLD